MIAVIDLGTNSIQLFLGQMVDHHIQVLDQYKVMLRLGKYLDQKKTFSEEAIQLTVSAFQEIQAIASHYNPIYRAVATYACREAKNAYDLFHRIEKATGICVELIDGLEEARLVSIGVKYGIHINDRTFLAIDCGGGSTEIIIGDRHKNWFTASLDLGSVILTEKFDLSHPSSNKIEALRQHILDKLEPLRSEVEQYKLHMAIASSSTGKTLANIHIGKTEKKNFDVNGYSFSDVDLTKIVQSLQKQSPKGIAQNFQIEERRAEIALAGAMVIFEIGKFFSIPTWTITTGALREGVFLDTIERLGVKPDHKGDVRWESIERFAEKTKVDLTHSKRVEQASTKIFDALSAFFPPVLGQYSARDILSSAAILHECGKFISYQRYHRHSHYLIVHSCLPGLSQHERELIGLVARFQKKGRASREDSECKGLSDREIKKVNILSAILRLASALNRTRGCHKIDLHVETRQDQILIQVFHDGSDSAQVNLIRGQEALHFLSSLINFPLYLQGALAISAYES